MIDVMEVPCAVEVSVWVWGTGVFPSFLPQRQKRSHWPRGRTCQINSSMSTFVQWTQGQTLNYTLWIGWPT